jgi:hypothetical protein
MDGQKDRQTDEQTDRHTDRQTDIHIQARRQLGRWTERQNNIILQALVDPKYYGCKLTPLNVKYDTLKQRLLFSFKIFN